jgi:polyhydroxyalkanoate synthesis regulator phasin
MVMVKDALRGYLALASGVTEVTAARARSAARVVVEQGEATAGQVTALAEDLVATSRRNREGLVLIIRHEVEATLRRLGLGPAGDVDALTQRVRRLEQTVRDLTRGPGSARANGSRPAKSTAKKSTAKKSTTKSGSAKKAAAKKSGTKKSTPKRTAARRTTTRSTGRRS